MSVLSTFEAAAARRRPGLLLLLDPDRHDLAEITRRAEVAERAGATALLVGTSFLASDRFAAAVSACREASGLPVVVFPGSSAQVATEAHALLFLSLISGRNPELLIGEHVRAALGVRRAGIETIPTGYMLVESGKMTSVQFISNTLPIPRDKADLAVAHAVAGELLGMRMIYMDAGSGGEAPVPAEMVRAVSEHVGVPLVVGGGLRTPGDVRARIESGADLVVVGTAFESGHGDGTLLSEMVDAASLDAAITSTRGGGVHPRQ